MPVKSKYSNVEPKPIQQANTGGNQGAYENVMKQEEEQNEIAQGGYKKKNTKGKSISDTYQAPGQPVTEEPHGGVGGSQENDESMERALESIEGFSNNNSSTSLQPANFQSGGQKNKHPLVAGDKVGSGKIAIPTEYGGDNQQGTDAMFQGGTENNLKEDANAKYDNEALSPEETEKALEKLQKGGAKRKTKHNKKSRKSRKTLKKKKTKTIRKSRKSRNSLKKKKIKGKKSSKHQRKTVRKSHKSKVQKRK